MASAGNKPIVIAVMGVTGTGKSTFIQKVTGLDTGVSDDSESATTVTKVYKHWLYGREVWFLDTPGFNASDQTDTKVLTSISNSLAGLFGDEKLGVNGVVYLHSIAQIRMGTSDKLSLNVFRKLVGTENLGNVFLVTTMWDTMVDKKKAIERETKFKAEQWDFLAGHPKNFRRIENSASEVEYLSIVRELMDNIAVTLAIQKELVIDKLTLDKTGAGKEVLSEVNKATEELKQRLAELSEELREAKLKSERDAQRLEEEKIALNNKLKSAADDHALLQLTLADLRKNVLEELRRQQPPPQPQPQSAPNYPTVQTCQPDYRAEYNRLTDLASSEFQNGKMRNAMQFFYQALAIALPHFGENHPDTIETRTNIDTIRDQWLGTNADTT